MKKFVLLSAIAILFPLPFVVGQGNLPMPTAPDGFEVTIFARPPQVNYPACICASPDGQVFVGVDKQGSLGKKPGQGKVLRCIDTDNDGVADKINTFAVMDHPRGLFYDNYKLWVLHPPYLTLYHDDDKDGKADRKETLITGITTDFIKKRGADHTTNGMQMGIDGWLYIAVGDFGFVKAKGKDGTTLTLRGGGIVRIRPDGTKMEIFSRGQRNIMDVCIDPQMNIFTRDNTNDGGGWDIRLSHVIQSANYGYPSLFKNFNDEIMPPLADYGGGSGCGGLFVCEPTLPKPFNRMLFTCDWGRSEVYYHELTPDGPTFKAKQAVFSKIPRPTDMCVDGSGRIYISSWHGGKFNYAGENVGFVAMYKPKGCKPKAFPDLTKLNVKELAGGLESESHTMRLHCQREILHRGKIDFINVLNPGNTNKDVQYAIYSTIFQSNANRDKSPLKQQWENFKWDAEQLLKISTDRNANLQRDRVEMYTDALKVNDSRIILAALISLGRIGDANVAKHILPLAVPAKSAVTVRSLPIFQTGRVKSNKKVKIKADIKDVKKLFLVIKDGGDGNGLDHAVWGEPILHGPKGDTKLTELKWTSAKAGWGGVHINKDCQNKPIRFKGKLVEFGIGTHAHSVIVYDLPKGYTEFTASGFLDDGSNGKGRVQFLIYKDKLPANAAGGGAVVTSDPKRVIPHIAVQTLVRLKAVDACVEAIGGPHTDGALWALRYMHDQKAVDGLIAKLKENRNVAQRQKILTTLIRLYHKEDEYKGSWWGTRPDTTGPYYDPVAWEESSKIASVVRNELLSALPDTVDALLQELDRHQVTLKDLPADLAARAKNRNVTIPDVVVNVPKFDPNDPNQIGNIKMEKLLTLLENQKGNAKRGAELFTKQSCVACHAIKPGQRPIGPQLADIGKRNNRKQLVESILKPSATLAQGFDTFLFSMKNGKVYQGFIVREAAKEVEVRTSQGKSVILKTEEIDFRAASKQSAMPEGLVNNLTAAELSSLLAYLNSLKSVSKAE